jgi:hypothetical protein
LWGAVPEFDHESWGQLLDFWRAYHGTC